jgi:predicted permease
LAFVFFSMLGAKLKWDKKVIGCLILTAGLGNTSFVGFPIIEAVLGVEALKYAVVLDQAGTFLICSTLGIWLALSYSEQAVPKLVILKRVLLFPPFVAFVISLLLTFMHWTPQGITKNILQQLASWLAPLALVSVGLQLKVRDIQGEWKFLTWGLGFKLLLAPMMIFFIYRALNIPQKIFEVALLESAMAPMITSSILAASYGLHPKLAGLMVGFGVPLSFLTLSAWYFLL